MRSIFYPLFVLLVYISCQPVNIFKKGLDFCPEANQVFYFAHQQSYLNDLDSLFNDTWVQKSPFGVVLYTALNLKLPNRVFGVNHLLALDSFFEVNEALIPSVILSIDKTHFDDVCEGKFDQEIDSLAVFLGGLSRPVMLSIGMEVNHPVFDSDPELFVAAYRCVVDKIQSNAVSNISYVWYIGGMKSDSSDNEIEQWFPGEEYVNWIGTSLYKILPEHYVNTILFTGPNYDAIFRMARDKDIPVMIMESSTEAVQKNFEVKGEALWNLWYEPFFQLLDNHPEIQAFSHLNYQWSDTIVKRRWVEKVSNSNIVMDQNKDQVQNLLIRK